jgi:hypothetical protein
LNGQSIDNWKIGLPLEKCFQRFPADRHRRANLLGFEITGVDGGKTSSSETLVSWALQRGYITSDIGAAASAALAAGPGAGGTGAFSCLAATGP